MHLTNKYSCNQPLIYRMSMYSHVKFDSFKTAKCLCLYKFIIIVVVVDFTKHICMYIYTHPNGNNINQHNLSMLFILYTYLTLSWQHRQAAI